jgi:hypothetical protein
MGLVLSVSSFVLSRMSLVASVSGFVLGRMGLVLSVSGFVLGRMGLVLSIMAGLFRRRFRRSRSHGPSGCSHRSGGCGAATRCAHEVTDLRQHAHQLPEIGRPQVRLRELHDRQETTGRLAGGDTEPRELGNETEIVHLSLSWRRESDPDRQCGAPNH